MYLNPVPPDLPGKATAHFKTPFATPFPAIKVSTDYTKSISTPHIHLFSLHLVGLGLTLLRLLIPRIHPRLASSGVYLLPLFFFEFGVFLEKGEDAALSF
jgi:hypothetical protein